MGGQSSKVVVKADMKSITQRGQRCVMSDPLDEYTTADQFWAELVKLSREQPRSPDGELSKDFKVEDEDDMPLSAVRHLM